MSRKAKFSRKKYMGVWRRGSIMVTKIMKVFPPKVQIYATRKIVKRKNFNSFKWPLGATIAQHRNKERPV